MENGQLIMKFELWKFIRNSTYLIIYVLILSLFNSFSGSDFGFTGLFFGVPFLIYWFSFKSLRIKTLTFIFFPISLFFLGGPNSIPKCKTCSRPLHPSGPSLHKVRQSRGFFFNFFKTKFYDVESAGQIRCHSPNCYPRNEIFQTVYKKDYVFLSKKIMLNKFYQDKHLIINLDLLDLNFSKSNTEIV
jgi:hypothetical protein